MGLSRRAYARHRGVSEMAVRKALASGRIALEPDGTIDPAKADAAWSGATDPAQTRPAASSRWRAASPHGSSAEAVSASRKADRPVPLAAVEAVRETLRESGEPAPSAGGMTFVQARTANEVIKAQERRIRPRAILSIAPARSPPCSRSHTWLHAECWPAWYQARRADAIAALRAMGIRA